MPIILAFEERINRGSRRLPSNGEEFLDPYAARFTPGLPFCANFHGQGAPLVVGLQSLIALPH